ncbi:MAG: undecaprenyl-phosphate glucose phosphotransferase [Clostridia bacterium]|nr:undecaprenyl-phosphate glucose phosphotransferase [Clostridia bacterium]
MIRKHQGMISTLDMISDGMLIIMSYFAAVFLRFDVLKGRRSVTYGSAAFILGAALCAAGIVTVLYALRVYRMSRRKSRRGEAATIMTVIGVFSLVFMAVLFIRRVHDFSRLTLALFWLISSVLVIGKHLCLNALMDYSHRRGFNLKHVLVVGSGHLARQYMEDIRRNPQLGYQAAGYVSSGRMDSDAQHLGDYAQLDEILDAHEFDEMIVALEPGEVQYMQGVLASAGRAGIRLSLIPFFNDYIPSQPAIDVIDRTRLIDMRATPLDHLGWAMVKRSMDIVGSLILILLSSPIMIAVAIGVKLSSPGPILFRQERIGLGKKPFKMYKFRSMRVNAAQDTGWSTDNDPRKTRFGSFIRKYSLDELPQFFNVLKGDMSLIGPRPEVPFHVNHFKEEIPLYLLRQQVRPGITGWAQVHGLRGDTSIEDRVKHDIWYIQNWSFLLDIRILLMTAFGGMINTEQI